MGSDAVHKRRQGGNGDGGGGDGGGGSNGSDGSSSSPPPSHNSNSRARRLRPVRPARRGRRRSQQSSAAAVPPVVRAVRVGMAALVAVWLALTLLVVEGPAPSPSSAAEGGSSEAPPKRMGRLARARQRLERLRIDPRAAGQRLRGVERRIEDGARRAERRIEGGIEKAEEHLHEAERKVEEMARGAMRRAEDMVAGGREENDGGGGGDEAKAAGAGGGGGSSAAAAEEEDHRAEEAALARVGYSQISRRASSDAGIADPNPWPEPSDELIDMRRLTATLPFDNPDGGAWKQGWDVEPQPLDPQNPLKVFVLPHSHCDPGWIKTFDKYFVEQTSGILTSVYNALRKDERRKFIWAEISYFEWWWRDQNDKVRGEMRRLIENGQFEFVTGGWVQPDEANTERYAIEVQLQEGRDWLRRTFGEKVLPKYGWSIDPFGYSPTMADVLKEYGFKGMLIQRVHYAVKKELALKKHLEFMWRQTWDKAGSRDMFTHVMPFYSYDVPHTCGPDPSVCCQFDFARLHGKFGGCPWKKPPQEIDSRNVKERSLLLLDQYQKKANLYRGNAVLVPLGDDFRYGDNEQAANQFTNYQRMFDYMNNHVPGVEVQFGTLSDYFRAIEGTFAPPVLKGSFFTYSDRNEDYWSGYFTSRVFDKALDRKLERVLYAATARGAAREEMRGPRRALSLFQHHDGVTGTAKNHVVEDYAKRMHEAIEAVQGWMLKDVAAMSIPGLDGSVRPCWKADGPRELGHNACDHDHPVYVYNPLETEQRCGDVDVPGRATVEARLPCEIAGPVTHGAASGEVRFDPTTGMMVHPVKEEWMVWKVKEGGAYLFFPDELEKYNIGDIKVERGGYLVSTPKWKRKVVEKRVPDEFGGSAVVLDFVFETLLQEDNREWFVRLSVPGLANGGVFHTDLNGFDFDTHHFRRDLPVQSQVFPMPTLASIEDGATRFTVLSEHAQGTASLEEGSIDLFLDRRLRQDDNRGLFQGVQDNAHTRTRLRALVETEGFAKAKRGAGGGMGKGKPEPEPEFEITPLCKRFWDELNHPLEVFGTHRGDAPEKAPQVKVRAVVSRAAAKRRKRKQSAAAERVVPFVYMVHKRLDYLKRAIDSLRESDFPRDRVPLIISHDGRVPEMVSYVETLKDDFNLVQLFHPFACYDHPHSFPGDDPQLNVGYRGDAYGNPRSKWATCAKHHWTWMARTVWDMDLGTTGAASSSSSADAIFFMEEDYVVAPNIYETISRGLELAKGKDFFGVTVDITNGGIDREERREGWIEGRFRTGPMAMKRRTWERIRRARKKFCTFDEYNWDWTVVKLGALNLIPDRVVSPSVKMVQHIGAEGMHVDAKADTKVKRRMRRQIEGGVRLRPFRGKRILPRTYPETHVDPRGNGGWGHPRDHEHCLEILGGDDGGDGGGSGDSDESRDGGGGAVGGIRKFFRSLFGGG